MSKKNVMCCVNDSEDARFAFTFACKNNFLPGRERLVLTHITGPQGVWNRQMGEGARLDAGETADEAIKIFAPFVKIATDAGFSREDIEFQIEETKSGSLYEIANAIVKKAKKTMPDYIVMGCRGCSNVEGALLNSALHAFMGMGSVSDQVLRNVGVPCIVLRDPTNMAWRHVEGLPIDGGINKRQFGTPDIGL